jgi:hypothetical protein
MFWNPASACFGPAGSPLARGGAERLRARCASLEPLGLDAAVLSWRASHATLGRARACSDAPADKGQECLQEHAKIRQTRRPSSVGRGEMETPVQAHAWLL